MCAQLSKMDSDSSGVQMDKHVKQKADWAKANRVRINAQRRERYYADHAKSLVKKKEIYQRKRLEILAKAKEQRSPCFICGKVIGSRYMTEHIARRHSDVIENSESEASTADDECENA